MTDKSSFGTEWNQHGRVNVPDAFNERIILIGGPAGYKMIIQTKSVISAMSFLERENKTQINSTYCKWIK